MGGFGLLDHHGEKTPSARLTSSHACLDVFELYRQGLTVVGASATLQIGPVPCCLAVHRAGFLEINGEVVRFVSHQCLPAEVWICPECSRDCYRIYFVNGGWRCRKCGNLTYPSKCRNRSIPNYARLLYLRRRLHAPEVPFAELPQAFPWQRKRWRLVMEVRKIEAALCGHAGSISATLEKRYGRDRRRRDP
jgi:hypothetical protein